jgi:uncharacterized membrane protein YbhN (UPF0104 family)
VNRARLIAIAILGLLTFLLLVRLGDIDVSVETLRRIQPAYLLGAIAVHYSGFVMRGERWRRMLAGMGHQVSFGYAFSLLLAGWFISALVPARAGDLARAGLLRRDRGIPMAAGLGSVAAERAFDALALVCLAALAGIWALAGRTPEWVWQSVVATSSLFAVAIIGLLAVPRLQGRLTQLFPWPFYQRALGFGFDLLANVRELGRHPILLIIVGAQSVYVWLCDVFLAYLLLRGLGSPLPLAVAAFTAMAADLAVTVPITPGAVGQFEAAFVGLLALFAVPASQASLAVLLNRFVSFWTFILFSGLVTYLTGLGRVLTREGQVVNMGRSSPSLDPQSPQDQ